MRRTAGCWYRARFHSKNNKANGCGECGRAEGFALRDSFLAGQSPMTVPAQTHARLLLDQSYFTTAYPDMQVSGGRDATVEVHYAESL